MTLMALFAFVATWYIQNKVTGKPNLVDPRWKRTYMFGMIAPLVLVAIVAFAPGKQDLIQYRISEAKRQKTCVFYEISADKLAYEIVNHYYRINIIDVRSPEEYAEFHIPMAINIPYDQIMEREWEHIFKQKNKVNVFYADADTLVRMACLKAKYIGKSSNLILTEHAQVFRRMYYGLERPAPEAPKSEFEEFHYRSQHALMMDNLLKSLQNIGKPVQKEIRQVRGGCS
jgi:rhodanese-related sulfurtransferase